MKSSLFHNLNSEKKKENKKTKKPTPLCLFLKIVFCFYFSNLQNLYMKLLYLAFLQCLVYSMSTEVWNLKP